MPAWGQSDGGPFNDEQVDQLISFIMYGTDQDWADIVTIRSHLEGSPSTTMISDSPAAAERRRFEIVSLIPAASFRTGMTMDIARAVLSKLFSEERRTSVRQRRFRKKYRQEAAESLSRLCGGGLR